MSEMDTADGADFSHSLLTQITWLDRFRFLKISEG
jgi:hypothetical protein